MKNKNITTLLQGMLMGVAEIIPGVSGSTLALIMGIYERFIDLLHNASQFLQTLVKFVARRSSLKDLKGKFLSIDWQFGTILVVGMLIAIAISSSIIEYAIVEVPHYLLAVFAGLIVASIAVPWRQIKNLNLNTFLLAIVSTIVVFVILGLRPVEAIESPTYLALFLGGIVGITGMVLPGVSGSFILLLLGLYEFITGSIKELTQLQFNMEKILGLMIFVLGLIFGFVSSVKLLKVLLERWRDELMAIITGLMVGSLRVLWPFIDLSIRTNQHEGSAHPSLAEYTKVWPWEMSSVDLVAVTILFVISVVSVQVLLKVSKPDEPMADTLEELS